MLALAAPRRVRAIASQWRRSLQKAYVDRFFAFTEDDFAAALRGLGIAEGDVLCVHAAFEKFSGFQGNVADAIRVLQEVVGTRGGLMMPTQPFLSSTIDYVKSHPVTDLARSPSYMGFMSEIMRRTAGVVRSIHPTHPVAVWGDATSRLVGRDWEARTPCGAGTAYQRLLDCEGKILFLGTGIQPMTFYHYVEEVLEPFLPESPFTTEEFELHTRDKEGCTYESRMRLHAPELSARRRMNLLSPELKKRGQWREVRIGRLGVIVLEAADVLGACRAMALEQRFCYLPES